MHSIDWMIMTLPLIICCFIAVYTRRYVRSVADFMAGGRSAGRFLICTARSEQGAGAAVFVSVFQAFLVCGFSMGWWSQLTVPVGLLVTITGFVVYRYRQTRAMTLGQFFEMRYNRTFRLFTGFLGFFAGIVNFGIIPAVGAQFMVAFLRFPPQTEILGFAIPTYVLLMAFFLTICVIMTTTAGQISVLMTDCAEGMFSQIFYTVIAIVLIFYIFKWSDTRAILLDTKPGFSMVNPFDAGKIQDFSIYLVLMGIFGSVYRSIAWQNSHGFNSSAATPHEARMGGILGRWRAFAATVMVTLLSVCAMTYFRTHTSEINAILAQFKDPATQDQMRSPVALTEMLPIGVKGMLLSICLMGIIAGDGIHLHSWGSIFIQDVIMPLRKKPLTPKQHIVLLRLSIVGVAVWAFLFGWIFPQTKYVSFWWSITEAIFVSGAGVAIIGGLYWKKGTTAGAWTSMIVGSSLAVIGIGTERILGHDPHLYLFGIDIHLNYPTIGFFASIIAVMLYITVSKLTCRAPHNMDKLLNRGAYAMEPESELDSKKQLKRVSWFYKVITMGIDEQFSRSDRWITTSMTIWSMLWVAIFAVGSIVYLIHPWSNIAWADYWLWTAIYLPLGIGVVTTIWFTWGCTHDMAIFLRSLRRETVDDSDDGSVRNSDEVQEFEVATAGRDAQHDTLVHPFMNHLIAEGDGGAAAVGVPKD